MNHHLKSNVIWSYDYELSSKDAISQIASMFSGVLPVHDHEGEIILTDETLNIFGDEDLVIRLSDIEQLYLGFDDAYPKHYIRNFGLFCQPLRITSNNGVRKTTIYLVLGYNGFNCSQTKTLFNLLQQILT